VKERHLKSIKADRMIRSEWKYGLIGEAAKGSPPSQEDLQAYRNQVARSVERQKSKLIIIDIYYRISESGWGQQPDTVRSAHVLGWVITGRGAEPLAE
jgi:hypothetical protein